MTTENKNILDYSHQAGGPKDPRLGRLAAIIVGCGFLLFVSGFPFLDRMSSRAASVIGITTFVLCVAGTLASTIALVKPLTRTASAKIAWGICLLWWSIYGFVFLAAL